MKIHLCAPFFGSKSEQRQAEFDTCLQSNVENPYIDRITLFIDDGYVPSVRHEKIRIVDIEGRLTYRDWLEFALSANEPEISVLCNTDISFDETISKLRVVFKNRNRFVALSRHEKIGDGLELHPDPKWSQDVWAVRSDYDITPEFLRDVDFMLGVPRCDNKIIYEACIHGMEVVNPFPVICAIHHHESQIRGYHKTQDRTLIGGMGFAHPCTDLMGASAVELSVWPLKTKNIKQLRVIGALEEWDGGAKAVMPDENTSVVGYDDEWQYPAITEKHAFDQMGRFKSLVPEGCVYLGFPWATLIDKLTNKPSEAKALLAQLENVTSKLIGKSRIITVCQHIRMLKFQEIFAEAGITDIFWSHKVHGQDYLDSYPGVKLHAFPLYPVQVQAKDEDDIDRRFLFSFVGARARDFYLTQVRTFILEELEDNPLGHVIGRGDWHYNKVVYDHQILGREKKSTNLVDEQNSLEFVETLKDSQFSLCPSGSGPNSIRLWESLGAGAIPVIMADTLELPGPQALWEGAAVFCKEEREAVKALPKKLEEIASDQNRMEAMRFAGKQLWTLYAPEFFVCDVIERCMVLSGDAAMDGEFSPLMSDSDLLDIAEIVLKENKGLNEANFFLLQTATSHALLRPKGFSRFYNRHDTIRKALNKASKKCKGQRSEKSWRQAQKRVKSISDNGEQALCDPVLSVLATGRSANRLPFSYDPYRELFNKRLQFVDSAKFSAVSVFAASKNISEIYKAGEHEGFIEKPVAVLSEEPLWDTTWGMEFDLRSASVRCGTQEVEYSVLNHMTTDIFKFEKIPYFVTTENKFAWRYARLFARNAAMSPEQLLTIWRDAPISQAYFAEKRVDERYNFERPDIDLYGYCAFRTSVAEAAKGGEILRVGQGWNIEATRRQKLPDWHLDKLVQLDGRTRISSAIENTHYPDYISEKIFDAYAVLAIPVYAASVAHRIHEFDLGDTFINVFSLTAGEAADKIREFDPDLEFAVHYLEAQKKLATLFANGKALAQERERLADRVVEAVRAVSIGEFE